MPSGEDPGVRRQGTPVSGVPPCRIPDPEALTPPSLPGAKPGFPVPERSATPAQARLPGLCAAAGADCTTTGTATARLATPACFALSPASQRVSACHSGIPAQQQTSNTMSVIFSRKQPIIFPQPPQRRPGNEHPSAALICDYGVIERDTLTTAPGIHPGQHLPRRQHAPSAVSDASGKRPYQSLGCGTADRADRLSLTPDRRIPCDE
jgi:hypothetical protein